MSRPKGLTEFTDDALIEAAERAAKGALRALEELKRRRKETQVRIERESANPDTGVAGS